jgi:hypothetical protein
MAFDLCHVDIRQLPNKRLSVGKIEHLKTQIKDHEKEISRYRRASADPQRPFSRSQSPK